MKKPKLVVSYGFNLLLPPPPPHITVPFTPFLCLSSLSVAGNPALRLCKLSRLVGSQIRRQQKRVVFLSISPPFFWGGGDLSVFFYPPVSNQPYLHGKDPNFCPFLDSILLLASYFFNKSSCLLFELCRALLFVSHVTNLGKCIDE